MSAAAAGRPEETVGGARAGHRREARGSNGGGMRAAVYHGRGDVRVETVPVPEPGHGELLLRVLAAGICGTDAGEWAHGPMQFPVERPHPVTGHEGPLVIGHEFAGEVVATGPGVDSGWQGRLVASCGAVSCGTCWQCGRGRTNLCLSYSGVGLHRAGGLAGFVATPVGTCEPVDDLGLTPDAAALGQPMSIAVHARSRGRAAPGERALVLGAGGIGALLVHALAEHGLEVTVADPSPERVVLARRLGAARVAPSDGPVSDLLDAMDGPPHVVFEATGVTAAAERAIAALPKGGRLVQVGMQQHPFPIDLRQLTLTELELIGTNALVRDPDFPVALRIVAARTEGWEDVAPVAIPLDALVADGLAPLAAGRAAAIKVLVDPWADHTRPTRTRPT
jgi:(R,R)-butanediol dehydrogenase/meso-butanediol dehydrogenase/diacetyl reductase